LSLCLSRFRLIADVSGALGAFEPRSRSWGAGLCFTRGTLVVGVKRDSCAGGRSRLNKFMFALDLGDPSLAL
jgi:hypothetical protein